VAEFLRAMRDPATVHAMCEDYRAAASTDLDDDRADRAAGRTVACPTLVLWGEHSVVGRHTDDVPGIWRGYAPDLTAECLPGGHFLPEEAPEATVRALTEFFARP
jgi:haloacetate dehalogenase